MRRRLGSVIGVLLFVVAFGAMTWRGVASAPAPRGSSWQAVLRIGHAAQARGDARTARRAYLTALFRARGERSLPGIVGAAEGFQALGDRQVVERALEMAAALGAEDGPPPVRIRLHALRGRPAATEALPMATHLVP
jgi:hypothetical protein